MKKKYLEAEVEIVKFGAEDIITTSGDMGTEESEEGSGSSSSGDDFGGDGWNDSF